MLLSSSLARWEGGQQPWHISFHLQVSVSARVGAFFLLEELRSLRSCKVDVMG